MKVLVIAPLPPPLTGHSLVSKALLDHLRAEHDAVAVNLSDGSLHDGRVTTRRIGEVLKLVARVWREQHAVDVVYLTVSESLAGNLKDLLIYLACWTKLSRTVIHLHGGSLRKLLFDRIPLVEHLNRVFFRRLGAAIISGRAHDKIFAGLINPRRIHSVVNFAPDELFIGAEQIVEKFASIAQLKVLYLSAMSESKGYRCLFDAYASLDPEARDRLELHFAGRFERPTDEKVFRRQVTDYPGIRYHGFVDNLRKRALLAESHVFCLPTKMFEGQPISILEAYASGCVVLATGQEGIRDIFVDRENGFEFSAGSSDALRALLTRVTDENSSLLPIALHNRAIAESKYRASSYTAAVTRVLQSVARPRDVVPNRDQSRPRA